ncbi:DNA circularization N-terminal domain-containing protein [Francisella philomiragia]|uniref:DNA circularization N-terminal domain-containing protein n=1 Tax=Francisella philomiragia TaxID=28110 RepID=UPI002242CDFB|nr:DNA circularization N-terminal domain-containing protein [Francisella philomiragia]
MSWQDRLKEAAYISPSGTRYPFLYENLSHSRDKNITEFDFPDVDGTYVQESGSSGRKFPIECIFWGDNYDQLATGFENALFEKGIGKLEHPIYGTFDVVPSGTITRKDDLKSAGNQSIVNVTFINTLGLIYPNSQRDAASEVADSIDNYRETASKQFAKNIKSKSYLQNATFKNKYKSYLEQAQEKLQPITESAEDLNSEFVAINTSINNQVGSIFSVLDTPAVLANQTIRLLQLPGQSLISIGQRFGAYSDLISSLIFDYDNTGTNTNIISPTSNDFYNKNLFASAYITGMASSILNTQFETKKDALDSATELLQQYDNVVSWQDDNIKALGIIDTGEEYQQLSDLVAITAGYVIEISFTLKQEKRVWLDRARTVIDLVAELYQNDLDSNIDFFIRTNNLSGTEILELPRDKEVVYYV